ncbi:MarR family winged helix-turn-helix transcriptional regulator [Streptococcus dentasini]
MRVEESWGFTLSKIAQFMDRRFSSHLSQHGLDYRDSRYYGVLLAIFNSPNHTQLKIGEKLSIDRTSIGQIIDVLEEKELVKRERNPRDRRQNVLALTAKGEKLVSDMWLVMRQAEHEVIEELSDSQKAILLQIAEQIS